MSKLTVSVLYFVATIIATNSYKILGIFPSLERNNYLTYRGLFWELANRNHEVTLISHFQMTNAPATHKDILLSDQQVYKGLSFESVIVNEISRVPFETLVATKAGNDDCKTLMNNHNVIHMIRTQPRYDIILVESYNSDCGLALAANLSAPYIAFNTQPIQPWQYNRLGISFNSAYVSQSGLPYGADPWFFERLKSFVLHHVANWVYYVGSQVTDHVYLYKYLGDDLPSLESIASNASLLFVNTHQSVFGGVARPDNVIDVGGIHIRPLKILPTEIERFINEAEHGVIYVNLGSTVKDSTMPKEKVNELLAAFRKLPLRILWKWDGGHVDLPNHHNIKAFVSHAGVLSAIEAIDAGVPVIAIPLFGDQYGNAAALQDAGVATIVSYHDLKKAYLLDAVNEVLDPLFQQRAKQVSRLWHDRPMSPLETAIYWTEYAARYQGAPNLQSKLPSIAWFQKSQIDVAAFVLLVLLILSYVSCKILSVLCCCCCRHDSQEDVTEERSSKRVKLTAHYCILLAISFCGNGVISLNILGVFPYEGKSHFFVFQPLLHELARRGHNLTVISHFPRQQPVDNYHDISLAGKSPILEGVMPLERSYWNIIQISLFLVKFGTENCKLLLEDEAVQELWKSDYKFDLVLVEQFNSDCPLGLAHALGAPVVGLTSHMMMPWHYNRFGLRYNPSYMPFMFMEGGTNPNIIQRVERTVLDTYFNILYKYFCQRVDENTLAKYIDDVPPLEELGRDIKLMLLYQHAVLTGSNMFPTNVKEVGGYHVAKPKDLPATSKLYIPAHPKVYAFYSHCGMLGTTEAMHHGVPMVGMPVFGDQPGNAALVQESGLGVQIQLKDLTKELLLHKFHTVLDPRSRVKHLSKAWHDRPLSPLDSAIYWIEYAAHHKNITFKSAAVETPLYRIMGLDILLPLLAMLISLIVLLKSLLQISQSRLLTRSGRTRQPRHTNMNILIALPLLFLVTQSSSAENILGIFPYQGKSHFFQFKVYLRELANRGHNVTVISYFPDKNPPPNYKDVHIADIKILEDDLPIHRSYLTIMGTGVFLTYFGKENCKALVASPQVQDLVKQKPKFDVVVVEQFNSDCALGIAHVLGSPVVGMTSHVLMPFHYQRFGIPNNPAFVSFHFLEGGTKPTFYQRVERFILDRYFNMWYTFQQWSDQNTLAEYYDNIPPLEELARDIKFLLLYQHHILTGSSLLPANVKEVGGYHVAKAKPLTGDLKKFVDEAKHGVIYISFGSMIKSTTLSDSKKQAILDAMNEFPQRFIWKWEDETMTFDKNKLYISSWLPQVDILGHPNTLAFMSHAGMGGTTESIHYGVPMVAVPIFGDQPANAAAIEESSLGVSRKGVTSFKSLARPSDVSIRFGDLLDRIRRKERQLHLQESCGRHAALPALAPGHRGAPPHINSNQFVHYQISYNKALLSIYKQVSPNEVV
ncbi:UDP-glycosyltransferase UGT44A2 [Operophtera brumata]|uniref:UDP-glycosyltransferase UGT44A2 n=1 Tax=Operophtera brumata TaxID=104452 RepID=A0A0L7LRH5_OPEBR|nr:UDP-glycosyltransferase UGT44A2 [Operophtera brumata]